MNKYTVKQLIELARNGGKPPKRRKFILPSDELKRDLDMLFNLPTIERKPDENET